LIRVVFYLIVLFVIFNAYGWFRNWQTENDPREKLFLAGSVPTQKPDGFHERNMPNYTGTWQGKKFDSANGRGVNIFKENGALVVRYMFRTGAVKSLSERSKEVYEINYDLPENPLWLRFLVDEIVENQDGTFTGKIHVKVLWMKYAVGWFSLK
jgi:hypothetical protein